MIIDPVGERAHAPYVQRLLADLADAWHMPELVQPARPALACLRFQPTGEIAATELREPSGDLTVDASIEHALAELRRERGRAPEPVPPELIEALTQASVCVRLRTGAE